MNTYIMHTVYVNAHNVVDITYTHIIYMRSVVLILPGFISVSSLLLHSPPTTATRSPAPQSARQM